jgi:hypothetical protein
MKSSHRGPASASASGLVAGMDRALLCLLFAAASCSAENDTGSGSVPVFGENGSDSGAAGSAGAVAGNGGGEDAGSAGGAAGSQDSGVTDACASISREPEQVEVEVETEVQVEVVVGGPVSLYVMLDQSQSMTDLSAGLATKWQVAVDSINAFVNDQASADVDMALQYFSLPNGDCATGAGYDTPEVPMGRLPDHAPDISASLALHIPIGGGGTPIEGALRGVTAYCERYKQDTTMNPEGRNCVAVLVTDGEPNGCNEDWNVLVGIAADAYDNFEVMTFAIGMDGANFDLLDLIGQAGHADCTPDPADLTWACNVSTGGMTFLEALNLIREVTTELRTVTQTKTEMQIQALECEWEIPEPPEGEEFNRDKVNVEFTDTGLDADKQIFGRVDSADECGSNLGWYYDDPNDPTRLIACEQACSTIQASETGKLNILLGCGTVIIE